MARIPTPAQLESYLASIQDSIPMVRDGFRWAAPDTHRRPKHGIERVRGGGRSDVADLVSGTDRYRTYVETASRSVVEADNALHRAIAALNDALALLEPPPGPEVADARLLEHPADTGDVARARAAQWRREQRARRSGDYSEVTG